MMKINFKTALWILLLTVNILSCSNDENSVEDVLEKKTEEETTEETIDTSLPCAFKLNNVQANSTIIINCILDLQGETITLPKGVTIVYEGGDIINGTINFSENSIIGGEILNSTLTVGGITPKLKDPIFIFNPIRGGIIEGPVSDVIARKNRDILESMMHTTQMMGVTVFKIDKMDAYFKTDGIFNKTVPQDEAIEIPSNFNLIMSNDTHLRVQPNAFKNTVLMAVFDVSNVTIEGGILHGDRDEHDYSDGGTHEWGHLLLLKACNSVTIKNMTMVDAGGDGIDINALGHSYDSFYKRSFDILITNNQILRSRRNNISVTDGYDIIIENNELIDAGVHTSKSTGTAPQFAIDFEAVRPSEDVYDILVKNNIERGSAKGGFTVHTGDRITFDGNHMENEISYSTSIGTIIKNNIFVAGEKSSQNGTAIVAGRNDRFDSNHGNRVFRNKITGFSTGIKATNTDLEIHNNEINNCQRSIVLDQLRNSKIHENIIQSTNNNSDGIVSHPTVDYMDNINIYKNNVTVDRVPFRIVSVNQKVNQQEYRSMVENNIFNGHVVFSRTNGFNFRNNTINKGILQIVNSSNINIAFCKIIAPNLDKGIDFRENNYNVTLSDTEIQISGNNLNSTCISGSSTVNNITINNINCIKQ